MWECEFSNCGSVPKNNWECGSVSFQISGSGSKNEWECEFENEWECGFPGHEKFR